MSSPDIRGGRPRIVGTGLAVQRIVGWYKLGLAPEDIPDEIGHLSLAQVYAALAYYQANTDEIEAAIDPEDPEADLKADLQAVSEATASVTGNPGIDHELAEPAHPLKSLRGLWKDLEFDVTEQEIDQARYEAWGNSSSEEF